MDGDDAAASPHRPDSHSPEYNDNVLVRQTHTKDLACKEANNNYHAVVSLVYLVAKSRCTPTTKAGRARMCCAYIVLLLIVTLLETRDYIERD